MKEKSYSTVVVVAAIETCLDFASLCAPPAHTHTHKVTTTTTATQGLSFDRGSALAQNACPHRQIDRRMRLTCSSVWPAVHCKKTGQKEGLIEERTRPLTESNMALTERAHSLKMHAHTETEQDYTVPQISYFLADL